MIKPLQVYLDEDDLRRLDDFARQRGWTKSHTIRAAVRALTNQPAGDPLLDLSGDIDGLPADLAEQFDKRLNETFVAEPFPATYRASRRGRTTKTVRR
jgi:hypothetical protein